MRAVRISGPRQFAIEQIEVREPANDEVLIRILATGFCGTDLEIFDGTMAYYQRGMAKYPIVPGHEWVGRIEALGTDVDEFSVGDHVVGECTVSCRNCQTCQSGKYHLCAHRTETGILNRDGAFAEYIVFPSASLHKISGDVDITAAALVEPTAIAFNGLLAANAKPGEGIAVYGDGPIGLLVLLLAKAFGITKIALIGGRAERLAIAKDLGGGICLNAFADAVEPALRDYFGGTLPTTSIEATGVSSAAATACRNTAPGGTVVLLGLFAEDRLKDFDLDQIVINDLTIRGALGSPHRWPQVISLIESGRVDPSRIVSRILKLSDFEAGIEAVRSKTDLKVIAVQDAGAMQ